MDTKGETFIRRLKKASPMILTAFVLIGLKEIKYSIN
jgi:hypothetical protein